MTAGHVHPMAQDRLRRHLKELDRALLKPQQRMYLLRTHVLPGLTHLLVLDPCTRTVLRKMDVSVRKYVRKWLRLPHDTSNAFIHAPTREGGLGVGTMVLDIPILKRNRMDSLVGRAVSETDPVLAAVVQKSAWLRGEIKRWSTPTVYAGLPMTSKENVKAALAWSLHSSVDGRGLRYHSLVPGSQDWVVNGSALQSGRDFIRAIQMRAGTLHTAVRAARGVSGANVKCDACGELESLAHVIQICARTARPRTQRHDSVVHWLQERFTRIGRQVLVEASIPTPSGVRRPDLVVYVPGAWAWVLDVTIVSDNIDPSSAVRNKIEYYSRESALVAWVAERAAVDIGSVKFSAVVLNWRGAVAAETGQILQALGLTAEELVVMSVRTMEMGYKIWQHFKDATWHGGRSRHAQ
jgi:hypothetical protein